MKHLDNIFTNTTSLIDRIFVKQGLIATIDMLVQL